MRTNNDELGGDPQSTLPPRGPARETRGRRLILGTPKMTSSVSQGEVNSAVHRGFTLGRSSKTDAAPSSKTGVQPWVLMVAGGAIVLLIMALLLKPAAAGSAEGKANERLLAQYTKYLEAKGITNADLAEKRKDAVARVQAVAWAKAVGDRAALERELTALLFLDNDKSSPLYQYSVSELKQLGPPRKQSGF